MAMRTHYCGHQDEHLQKLSEAPLAACPSCGKPTYKKLLSAAGFQLKGSGWYATDFKSTGKKKEESKTETKTETKTDAKTETKTDAKPEAKPESKPKSEATTSN